MTITTTLAEAIDQGYVVMREGYQVYTAFFRYCQETDAPFIYAKLRPNYTAIYIDLIGQSYRMTEACWREVRDLLKAHHVGVWGDTLSGMNRINIYSPRIPHEDAEAVCRGLVAILSQPRCREQKPTHST